MLALPALALFAIAAALILLSFAYEHTFHVVLARIAKVFIDATWHGPFGLSIGFAFIGHAINSLDNGIRDAFYAGIQGSEWAWHKMLHATAVAWQQIGETVHQVANDGAAALDYLRRHTIPTAIAAALLGPWAAIRALQALVHDLRPVVHDTTHKIVKTVTVEVPHALTRAEEAAIAALVHVPAAVHTAVAIPQTGIDYVGREVGALRHRVDGLARQLRPAAVAGLVAAAAFSVLGLGWLKCSNVGKVGRRVCGLDSRILDGLLAGLIAVFGTIGLVAFARDVQAVAGTFATDVARFWRANAPGPGGDRGLGQAGHKG